MAFLSYSVAETSKHHGEYNASHTENENFFCRSWGFKKYWLLGDWLTNFILKGKVMYICQWSGEGAEI